MNEPLTTVALSALRWNYLGFLARSVSIFIIGVLLARLLGPKPFGQIAVAMLALGLANFFADAGFSSALVQVPRLTAKQIRFAFTCQMLIGMIVMIAAQCAAPWIAVAFHDGAIRPVLIFIAPIFLLQSLGQTSTGLLKRKMAFQEIQTAQVASYLVGYLFVGLPAAYLGAGVWSLVAAQLTQALAYSVLVYLRVRHSVAPCLDRSGIPLLRFGSKTTGANILNWTIGNLDNAVIGHSFGSMALGLYNRAFNLANSPAEGVVFTCQQVLFASCSRAEGQLPRIRRAYLAALGAMAILTLPFFWSACACAQTVITGLFGTQWREAGPLFRPLALVIPLHALMGLSGPVLSATNHVEREVRAQFFSLIAAAAAFAIAVRYSVAAVAWSVVFVYAVRCWVVTAPTLRLLAIGWRQIVPIVRGPIAAAIVTTLAVYMVNSLGTHAGLRPTYLLPLLVLTGAATLAIVVGVAAPLIFPRELIDPFLSISERLPSRLSRALQSVARRQAVWGDSAGHSFEPSAVCETPGVRK